MSLRVNKGELEDMILRKVDIERDLLQKVLKALKETVTEVMKQPKGYIKFPGVCIFTRQKSPLKVKGFHRNRESRDFIERDWIRIQPTYVFKQRCGVK